MAAPLPTPQPNFPGDTVMNPEEDFWAPWPEGTEGAPGQRGEFVDIPKQSPFGAFIPPASGASPNRDDTQRKEELPAMYNPDRLYGRKFHEGVKWVNPKRIHLVTADMEFDAFLKTAATREEYLISIGVTQEIVQWVMQQDDDTQKYLIGLLRKTPDLGALQLHDLAAARAEKMYKPEKEEITFVNNLQLEDPELRQWVLHVFKKARVLNNVDQSSFAYGPKFNYALQTNENADGELTDIYGAELTANAGDLSPKLESVFNAITIIAQWYAQEKKRNTAPQLASLTFPQALEKAQAANAKVTFTFPDGWTMRELLNPSALALETLRMDNCVGKPQHGWVDQVQQGTTSIFSLRDPTNDSCATIAVDRNGRITEALGPSNEELGAVEQQKVNLWAEKNNLEFGNSECEENGHDWSGDDEETHLCDRCGEEESHNDWITGDRYGGEEESHYCETCGWSESHTMDGGRCRECGWYCEHQNGLNSDGAETHSCEDCGMEADHKFESDVDEHTCQICGDSGLHEWQNGQCTVCGEDCTHEWEVAGDQAWYCERCDGTGEGIPEDLALRYQFDVPGDFDETKHTHAFVAANGIGGASAKVCRHCGKAVLHASELEIPQETFPFRTEAPAAEWESWLEQREREEKRLRKTIDQQQRERGAPYRPKPYEPHTWQPQLPLKPRESMTLLELDGFIKQAGSREEYLQSLNVRPEVIAFVLEQPEEQQKWFINEVRKNPSLTLQQLQALQAPKQEAPYTQDEYTYATRIILQTHLGTKAGLYTTWILTQMRKNRSRTLQDDQGKTVAVYKPLPWDSQMTLTQTGEYTINDWWDPLLFIADWYRNSNVEIASYSLEQAWAAQQAWHNTQASKGNGTQYEEQNVINDLGQLNPKWQGWTLQVVQSANDLECEGNKMGHCVGSYAEEVAGGGCKIYSLRDPQNEPHVTIETNGEIGGAPVQVVQIQGKGNTEPKPEYQKMLKTVFGSYPKGSLFAPEHFESDTPVWDTMENASRRGDRYPEAIAELYGEKMELDPIYGLAKPPMKTDTRDLASTYKLIVSYFETAQKFQPHVDKKGRTHMGYQPIMGQTAEVLAVAAIEHDKKNISPNALYRALAVSYVDVPYVGFPYSASDSAVYLMKMAMAHASRHDRLEIQNSGKKYLPDTFPSIQIARAAEGVFQEYAKTL